MVHMNTFREALRSDRKRLNLTLAQVAFEAGVTIGYLSDIERGNREPSEELALHLCQIFQIDPDFYFACVGRLPLDLRDKAPAFIMDRFVEMREYAKDKGW